MRLEVKLLPVQKALYKSEKQIAGIYSARGVGKSYVLSFLIAIAVLKGERVLAFSQTYKSLSQNLFDEVLKRFETLKIQPTYNKGAMTIGYNKVICFGYSYENCESSRRFNRNKSFGS